jgi:hypothetical protein
MKKTRIIRLMLLAAVMTVTLALLCGAALADEYDYEAARSMLAYINEFRTSGDAWYWEADNTTKTYVTGLSPLKYDYDLEAVAMLRASEIAVKFSHTRPDGSKWSTAFPSGNYYRGENIASGFRTADRAFNGFREDNERYDGQGHRRNMLRAEYTRVGIGAVKVNGIMYWAQAFASGSATAAEPSRNAAESKVMSTGWAQENGHHIYVDANGAKVTGWLQDGGTWYYMDANGYMLTGWVSLNGTWYYFQPTGALVTGWFQQGKDWYYADSSGALYTGWQNIAGVWYHFEDSCAMNSGWFQVGGDWYYSNASGAMQTGWQNIDNVWYYFKENGAMATGVISIDGQYESFSSSGVWEGTVLEDYNTPLGTNPLIQLLRLLVQFLRGLGIEI